LIRSGEYRFGVYLTQAPLPTAVWNGNPQCYLFSLSLNLKLPFHGRSANTVSLTNDDEMTNHALSLLQEPHGFFGTNEMLMIGDNDLVIDSKLMNGRSEIEMSYGIGLSKRQNAGSVDLSKTLLAGSTTFPISDLEVWTVQY
jgi:hypothetical protein